MSHSERPVPFLTIRRHGPFSVDNDGMTYCSLKWKFHREASLHAEKGFASWPYRGSAAG